MGYKTEIKPHMVFVEKKNDEYHQWRERKDTDGAKECLLLIAQPVRKGSQSYEKRFSLCSISNVWFGEVAKQTASLLPLWASYYETTVLIASRCGVPNLNTSPEKTDSGLSMWIFIRPLKKVMLGHGVVVQTCLLSVQETEAELRLLGVQGQPDLCGKFQASQRYTVRFKKKKKKWCQMQDTLHLTITVNFL